MEYRLSSANIMSENLIMLLLNRILENIKYNVGYTIHIYTRVQNCRDLHKDANINFGNIPWNLFHHKSMFPM